MAGLLGDLILKLFGVYLFTIFVNFLIKKRTKQDNVRQKVIAVFISTVACIVIPMWITQALDHDKIHGDIFDTLGGILITIFCGVVVASFYALRFNIKQFYFVLLYGAIFWFIFRLIVGIVFRLIPGILVIGQSATDVFNGVLGTIVIGIVYPVTIYLIYKQKLPWTKNIDKLKKSQEEANGSL